MRFSPPVGRLYARALLGRQSLFSPIPASKADMPLGGFTDGLPAGGTSRGEGAAARSRTGMTTGVYGRAVHDRCTRVCNPPLCPRGAFGGTVPGQLWRICGGFVMWVTAQSWVHHTARLKAEPETRGKRPKARGKLGTRSQELGNAQRSYYDNQNFPQKEWKVSDQSERNVLFPRVHHPAPGCAASALSVAAFAPRKGLRMLNAMTRRPAISDDSEPSWESPVGDFAGTPEFRGFHQSSRLFSEKRPLMRLWPDRGGWCLFCMMSVLLLEAMEIP